MLGSGLHKVLLVFSNDYLCWKCSNYCVKKGLQIALKAKKFIIIDQFMLDSTHTKSYFSV